jgi:hypothetical protein
VAITLDVTNLNAPDNKLGSYDGTFDWNPALLSYRSNQSSGGFLNVVNDSSAASGHISFSGVNPAGATGNIIVLNLSFDVLAAGTSPLQLAYTSLTAAATFKDILPLLIVTSGSVTTVE